MTFERLTSMRFAALALLVGCAASHPAPPVAAPRVVASPPQAPEQLLAKSPVVRFEKTALLAFPTSEHGLAPRASVSYADVACRSASGKTTCAMRAHGAERPEVDLQFQARLEQCFRVAPAALPPAALRALESSPTALPRATSTFLSVAVDARAMESVVMPVMDCPNGFPPYRQCPATQTVQTLVDHHTFDAYVGRSHEHVGGVFAMRWEPAVFAIVEGDWRFTQRVSDPREVLASMESMPLEKEGDEVRFANLVDRAVLAFQTHAEKKAAAYVKDLDAWLATHRSGGESADFEAMRATFAALTSGALRTTDPCASDGPLRLSPPGP